MIRLTSILFAAALCVAPVRPADAQDASQPDADMVDLLERRTQEVAAAARQSVVGISAQTRPSNGARTLFPGVILVPPDRAAERLEAAGFFIRDSGELVTTIEIARDPAQFTVRLANGSTRSAELVGTDEEFRIAVLRLVDDAAASPLGNTAPRAAGVRAIADATPFDAGRRTIAWIVVPSAGAESADAQIATVRSATCNDSRYDRFLASSLALAQGAAGAPLLTKDGRLLGVAVGSAGLHVGSSGALEPCRKTLFVRGDDALAAATEILRDGRVRRARLGVLLDGDTNRVDQVIPGGPAELAGFRDGDQVVTLAGTPVADAPAISRVLLRRRPGDVLPAEVRRGDATVNLRVTVDEITMPRFPAAPPVPGAVLEIAMFAETPSAAAAQVVSIRDIAADGPVSAAGGKVGDEIVSIDGIDARRFLQRHRVRAAPNAPGEIVVRRDGVETKLVLRR